MKNIILIAVLALLTGCASVPTDFGVPAKNSKIGVMLLIEPSPSHAHVGTTIFQNEVRTDASTTSFVKRFEQTLSAPLAKEGFNVTHIASTPKLLEERSALFSYLSSYVSFKGDIKAELNKVAAQAGVDYVMLVYPTPGPAWPNSAAFIEGYGLYTRCFLTSCNAFSYDYISARIYDVKNQSTLAPMTSSFYEQKAMPHVVVPSDISDVQASDVDKAGEMAFSSFVKVYELMLSKARFL